MNEELFELILFIITIIAGFVAGVICGKDD